MGERENFDFQPCQREKLALCVNRWDLGQDNKVGCKG